MKKYVYLTLPLVLAASTAAVAGVHIVGGAKYAGDSYPWYSIYLAGRFHCMWYQKEINEAGLVSKIEFQFHSYTGKPPTIFNNVDMLLCHSGLNTLTNNFQANYGGNTPVKVYYGSFIVPSGLERDDWLTQCKPTNFTYNNKDNLLFEISWSVHSAGASANYFWRARTDQPGRVWATNKTASTGTLLPNHGEIARITINPVGVAPTSLGRVKSLFK